jgi:hypothetical protein
MSKRNLEDLVAIAQKGGGFDLSASDYTATELVTVADTLCSGATLRVRDVDALSTAELGSIAQHGPPGAVRFAF